MPPAGPLDWEALPGKRRHGTRNAGGTRDPAALRPALVCIVCDGSNKTTREAVVLRPSPMKALQVCLSGIRAKVTPGGVTQE